MLGYSKFEWALAVVIGVAALWFLIARDSGSDSPPKEAINRASAAEVMECESRIKAGTPPPLKADVKTLLGMSSDKQGPGGTSRVKLYFDVVDPSGSTIEYQAVCQFANGAPPLVVNPR